MKRFLVALFLIFASYPLTISSQNNSILNLVDPMIGTGGHGHTYPGAVYPFGMVQLSPDTRLSGWDGCSAYHYSDSIVYGFSHTHLSGTGVSDYGDILFMPYSGKPKRFEEGKIASSFNHSEEKASPGYYHCHLEDYDIDVDLSVTPRCGMHEYTFKGDNEAFILLDLMHRDFVIDSYVKINNSYEVEGYRISSAWAKDQRIYFVARFSLPFESVHEDLGSKVMVDEASKIYKGDSIRLNFAFDIARGDQILVKIGVSAVSIDGARANLLKELPNWDFDGEREKTEDAWINQLKKIEVFGGSLEEKRIFYTALYHTMIVPNLFSDVDGKYRGLDGQIYEDKLQNRYTVFSLWDTYRATHPLYTLLERNRTSELITTMIGHYEQSGLLPVWELAGNETNCMIGTHGVSVIADAIMKDMEGFDYEKAYEAMKASLEQDKHELNVLRDLGYMPSNEVMESVSKTLEYAYNFWCIAQVAKKMGKEEDYGLYTKRAQFYKNIFDVESGFMRPKLNGSWREPFDPKQVDFNFTEANSWQYSFYAPQDLYGLIDLMGGEDEFEGKLDELFSTDSRTTGRHQADITGLIGQYAHGNEPSHHMAYLYNYIGKPWKSNLYIDRIMQEMYDAAPDGYSGNEDCGQMSAWYVFTALGFYPVSPGSNDYILGKPLFPRVILNFEDGKYFIIEGEKRGMERQYVQSIQLNKKPYKKSYIRHKDIINGGKLSFYMGEDPSDSYGTEKEDRPISRISDYKLLITPTLKNGKQTFRNNYIISFNKDEESHAIKYRIRKKGKRFKKWKSYKEDFTVDFSGEIEFYAEDVNGNKSYVDKSEFNKIEHEWKLELKNPYSNQYTGGGNNGLIDKVRGKESFADGSWQGYQGVDFDAILDMGKVEAVNSVRIGSLQSQRSWIWFPEKIEIYGGTTKDNLKALTSYLPENLERESETMIKNFELEFEKSNIRFIRIVAVNKGLCPDWHPGAGGKTWIFLDEIDVN